MVKPPCDEAAILAPIAVPWALAVTILGSSMAFIDGTSPAPPHPKAAPEIAAAALSFSRAPPTKAHGRS